MTQIKYCLTEETRLWGDVVLRRIQALRDLPNGVKAGDMGGWVQSETNLSQLGGCWVWDDAIVADSATVSEEAQVRNLAQVYNKAMVKDRAVIQGEARVYDSALVLSQAVLEGDVVVCDQASVAGQARLGGSTAVGHTASIDGTADLNGDIRVFHQTIISGRIEVRGNVTFADNTSIQGCGLGTIFIHPANPENRIYFKDASVKEQQEITKTPLVLKGLQWKVTITDSHMKIGCQSHPIHKWKKLKDPAISVMHEDALDFWSAYKEPLMALCAAHTADLQKGNISHE